MTAPQGWTVELRCEVRAVVDVVADSEDEAIERAKGAVELEHLREIIDADEVLEVAPS